MTFRLEALLKLRKNEEELKQKEFSQANGHFVAQKKRLEFMEQVDQRTAQNQNTYIAENPRLNVMGLYTDFFNGIREQEKRQRQIIAEIGEGVEVKRSALTEAMRKRKTLEILKDRQILGEKQKRLKEEIGLLDETSSNLWWRKRFV